MFRTVYFAAIFFILSAGTVQAATTNNYRLELAKANLHTKKSEETKAWDLYKKILNQDPVNQQALTDYAVFLYQIGRTIESYETTNKLVKLYPNSVSTQIVQEDLFRDYRSYVKANYKYEAQEDTTHQHISTFSGEYKYNNFDLGASYKHNNFDSDQLRRADGDIEKISVEETIREFYLQYNSRTGNKNKLSAYFSDNDSGLGNEFYLWNIKGYNKLTLEYQRPNWDYLEGIADSGTRDRFALTNLYRITPSLVSTITLGLNKYGIAEDSNVGKSQTVTANLSYSFSRYSSIVKALGNNGYVSISYNIDGEYKSDLEERLDSSNVLYNPLPISTREIHTVTISAGKEVSTELAIDAYLGYSKNRFDNSAPAYGTKLTYKVSAYTDLVGSVDQALSTDGNNNKVQTLNIYLKQRF